MGDTVKEMALPFLLRRVELRNYRSIEHCDVELGPLMFLVGPNGSGKSNFLDALRFVSDCLNTSVDQALRVRGGFGAVCRRAEASTQFSIKLIVDLVHEDFEVYDFPSNRGSFEYEVEIAADADRSFQIRRERCRLTTLGKYKVSEATDFERVGPDLVSFTSQSGHTVPHVPRPSPDRLYLANFGDSEDISHLVRSLSSMAFYSPNVAQIRDYQSHDLGDRLTRDGSNSASVFRQLQHSHPDWAKRIFEYLSVVLPRLRKIVDTEVGEKVTFQFTQAEGSSERTFYASSMSDGTLRMLAVLLALFQRSKPEQRVSLVGIEEPEMGLHPAAAEVLFDSLNEASAFRQILVTSHSSELLDHDNVDADSLLAVSAESGSTIIGPIDDRQKTILKKKLGTAGELLRRDLLQPNELSHK